VHVTVIAMLVMEKTIHPHIPMIFMANLLFVSAAMATRARLRGKTEGSWSDTVVVAVVPMLVMEKAVHPYIPVILMPNSRLGYTVPTDTGLRRKAESICPTCWCDGRGRFVLCREFMSLEVLLTVEGFVTGFTNNSDPLPMNFFKVPLSTRCI